MHANSQNTYSRSHIRALKNEFQEFSVLPSEIFDMSRAETVRNCLSITRYRLVSKGEIVQRHIDLGCHQSGNGVFLRWHQSCPRSIIVLDNIGDIQPVKAEDYHME